MPKPWKVFKFPTGFDSEWISISKDKHFESCPFGIGESLKWFKNRSLDASIDKWLDYSFGRLALECWEGKHEDFCVWRAEEEKPKENTMKKALTLDDFPVGTIFTENHKNEFWKYRVIGHTSKKVEFVLIESSSDRMSIGTKLSYYPDFMGWATVIKDKQMTTNPSTFWLVWNPEGWSPPKYRHYSLYDAEQEATRLAQQHPGQEFHVLEVKSKFVAGKITKTEFVESDDVPF